MTTLKNSNLSVFGTKRDVNGNKVIMLRFPKNSGKGFSIQMNQNLPKTRNLLSGVNGQQVQKVVEQHLEIVSEEILNFVLDHGSKRQIDNLELF